MKEDLKEPRFEQGCSVEDYIRSYISPLGKIVTFLLQIFTELSNIVTIFTKTMAFDFLSVFTIVALKLVLSDRHNRITRV